MEAKYRLAEKERLAIESEVSQLRSSPFNERDSPFDMTRSSIVFSDSLQQVEVLQSRVNELETFIIEQVMCWYTLRIILYTCNLYQTKWPEIPSFYDTCVERIFVHKYSGWGISSAEGGAQ